MISWDDIDEMLPPPDGMVGMGKLGTVIMSKKTFEAFQDYAEGVEIKWEREEDGDRPKNSTSVTRDKQNDE